MAYKDFRPDYEYLKSLGFIEVDSGEKHPFDRFNELIVNSEKGLKLCMNAFWDFSLETPEGYFEKFISSKEQLESYIETLKT